MAQIAARRKLEDLSIGPVLTWTTRAMLDHVDRLLQIPGAAHPLLRPAQAQRHCCLSWALLCAASVASLLHACQGHRGLAGGQDTCLSAALVSGSAPCLS